MEGYLDIWHGFFKRWHQYYFRIHEDMLMFGATKEEIQSKIHLKVAQIVTTVDDPVSFIIHTGTQSIRLRAYTIQQRVHWVKKLKSIQKQVEQANYIKQISSIDNKNTKIRVLEQLTVELWQCHADLENIIDQVTQRMKMSGVKNLVDKLRITVQQIKLKNSSALKIMQEHILESSKQQKYSKKQYFDQQYQTDNDNSFYEDGNYPKINNEETKFLSFMDVNKQGLNDTKGDRIFKKKSSYISQLPINSPSPVQKRRSLFSSKQSFATMKQTGNENSDIEVYTPSKKLIRQQNLQNPIKQRIVFENQAFKQLSLKLPKSNYRNSLPAKHTPEQKISFIDIFSGAGTDLTKFSFPVTMNQPLSMLQKSCERMYYSKLLDQANAQTLPELRMAYVAAFIISQYSLSDGRYKKPSNPLYGETYQFIDQQRQFSLISEQVSHHPPISASYARSNNFQVIDDSRSKTSFTGTSIKIIPESKGRIILEKYKDVYIFNKCPTYINGLVMGKLSIESSGKVLINCKKFNSKASLTFKQSSFWSNKDNSNGVQGNISVQNKQLIGMKGKWNTFMSVTEYSTKNTFMIWQKTHNLYPEYYNFNQYSLQLNYLNENILTMIAPTDSRLRPDQRALEYQNIQLASSEKNRLEVKQRNRKKQNQLAGIKHQVLWFEKQVDEDEDDFWVYKDGYWEERRRGGWQKCLDIF